jgi:trk system potassium uptake protein TrkA
MKLVVIGCGRVGSAVAKELAGDGWDVTAIDEQEEALTRLGSRWSGGFVVGHGMDAEILRRAGVPDADAVVVATSGDNTNLVIAQVVEKRWAVPCVVVRVLDPARAEFYAARGMRTICPTQTAISALATAVRKEAPAPQEASA